MPLWPERIYNWGSTEAERSLEYPCDLLLPDPDEEMYRAVDVDAPPATVFRWLCQLRVAPYSYDWIDNFGRRSPQSLTPGLDELEPGQEFMRIFELDSFEPGRSITIRSRRSGPVIAAVTYLAEARPPGGSRLLVKFSCRYNSRPVALLGRIGMAPGDLVMMRRQLLQLKRLAEHDS
jgi:hypothetical protein